MASLTDTGMRDRHDLARFEAAMPLAQRLPERSVLDVFIGAAAARADATAITLLMTGAPDESAQSVSYGQLLDLIRRAANAFTAIGGPRPRVAYMLPHLIETHAALWGAEVAGHAVPINHLLAVEPIAALLAAAEVQILVALGPHPAMPIWEKALALRACLPHLTLVCVGEPGLAPEPGVIDWHSALMAQPGDRLTGGEAGRDGDVAAYFHTGGTTGTPKLVAHTHRGQLVAAMGGAVLSGLKAGDVVTATLPMFHVGGTIYGSLSPFMVGASLLIMSPNGLRDPAMVKGFWRLVAQHRVNKLGAVPTSIGAVLDVPLAGADLSALRTASTGAAALPAALGLRFQELTGRRLCEVYGMTEASGLIAVRSPLDEGGEGSVGWPLPYTDVVIRRRAASGALGAPCAVGEVGVITVRGPHVSPGYRLAAHNADVIENGELNSGDLGYFDSEGRLHLAGRAKDLIIRSGHNIDPLMIEAAMVTHPAVALAAAVGMPDAYAGELPICFVELKPGAATSENELHDHAQRTIAERPAWPKRIVIVPVIPLTAVGKVYKPPLRCQAAVWLVEQVLQGVLLVAAAQVRAQEGGVKGLQVTVTLAAQDAACAPGIEQALSVYLFELKLVLA